MKRTTISLPDRLAGVVEREARRRHTSVSEIIRAAITSHFKLDQPREIPFANVGRSGLSDLASNMDHYLAQDWADWIERDSFSDR